jgi:hypothetical protein
VVLLAAASSMSACIIPVAPDFQDPQSRPDSPPKLTNFMPEFGLTTSVPASGAPFSVSASDPDPGTTFYIRWVVDYPPYTATTNPLPPVELPAPAEGEPPLTIGQPIDCTYIRDPSTSTHSVELIVADVPLAAPDTTKANAFEQLTNPAGAIAYGRWPINITCPQFMPTP